MQQALQVLEELAPLRLAEGWDNVGLLVEPTNSAPEVQRIFLAIDLTDAVFAEAVDSEAELLVAYHPPIFGGLKRLSARRPGQRLVVEALRRGVFVYSPHTAVDAAAGGMNDWLAEALGPGDTRAIVPAPEEEALAGAPVGQGRYVSLATPVSVREATARIKRHLGLEHVRVAEAAVHEGGEPVRTFAVCPGAGGSVFEKVGAVDLLLTGEMRHHDILARAASGTSVVVCDHTNTERGYLPRFADRLRAALPGVDFVVSSRDRDPLRVA